MVSLLLEEPFNFDIIKFGYGRASRTIKVPNSRKEIGKDDLLERSISGKVKRVL